MARCGESNPLVRLEPCLCMVLCRWRTPHVWLGAIRPRSQCVGGMLPVQWCYKHVLELTIAARVRGRECGREVVRACGWPRNTSIGGSSGCIARTTPAEEKTHDLLLVRTRAQIRVFLVPLRTPVIPSCGQGQRSAASLGPTASVRGRHVAGAVVSCHRHDLSCLIGFDGRRFLIFSPASSATGMTSCENANERQ